MPPLLIEAALVKTKQDGVSQPHRLWSTAPLLDLVLQHLSPPSLLACLAVSSTWYRSALPLLFHTPHLRSSADVLSFFGGDGRATSEAKARRLDGLRWVREVVLMTGCVPEEHVSIAHLRRSLASLGAGSEPGQLLLPRLRILRFSYSLAGWAQLLTPPISATSSSRYGRLEHGVEVLSERSPPLVGHVLVELLAAPRVVLDGGGGNSGGSTAGETHVHLSPTQHGQLAALVAPLRRSARTWSFDRVFFHTVRERHHPLPTLLLGGPEPRAGDRLELHFAPLGERSRTTAGLSLNPWDRRQSILAHAASLASAVRPVVVHGVSSAHLDVLPETDGLTFAADGASASATARLGADDAAAGRAMPSLTDEQVGALFYRGLSVGWSALSQRVMSFSGVRA